MKQRAISLSVTAKKQFESICEFLELIWSDKTKKDFIKRLDEKFQQVALLPESCPESTLVLGLRRAVVDKRCSFMYEFDAEEIKVLVIFDNRQSDDTIKSGVD